MKRADVIGLSAGLAVLGLVGYEAWKSNQTPSSTSTHIPITGSGSGSITGTGLGVSSYGTDPTVVPTNCPVGYSPVFQMGYGWTCVENGTATQQYTLTLPALEQQTQAAGDPVAQFGMGITGSNAKSDALAAAQFFASQYGGEWSVYLQNGKYSVYPAARVAQLQAIPGSQLGTLVSQVGSTSTPTPGASPSGQPTNGATSAGSGQQPDLQATGQLQSSISNATQQLAALVAQKATLQTLYAQLTSTSQGLQTQVNQLSSTLHGLQP